MRIVYRCKKMKEMSPEERKASFTPRVCIFGGKAFATYVQAKRIVKFITDGGVTVNHDPDIGDLLKVVFVPDYNVSVAEVLIPSNGANVKIRQEVGEESFFLFGARAHEIAGLRKERAEGKVSNQHYQYNNISQKLMGSLEGNEGYGRADYFLVGKDFPSYIECQEKVDEAYRDLKRWTKMSILNTAGSYKLSSDRTIHEYARDIWRIELAVLPNVSREYKL
ncbi:hypothetical protein KPL70_013283 [Citrus sinensis]|nr:hypothetical protein KPL70_013283 [Citrus sinensis]